MILSHTNLLAKELKNKSNQEGLFNDKVISWWKYAKSEYIDYDEPWEPLSKLILISWINKLTFANILKRYNRYAYLVNHIKEDLSIDDFSYSW
jgi:hypothetical protein